MTCSQDKVLKVIKNNNEHGCHTCVLNKIEIENRKAENKIAENEKF